jgi:hypothetical protein
MSAAGAAPSAAGAAAVTAAAAASGAGAAAKAAAVAARRQAGKKRGKGENAKAKFLRRTATRYTQSNPDCEVIAFTRTSRRRKPRFFASALLEQRDACAAQAKSAVQP